MKLKLESGNSKSETVEAGRWSKELESWTVTCGVPRGCCNFREGAATYYILAASTNIVTSEYLLLQIQSTI